MGIEPGICSELQILHEGTDDEKRISAMQKSDYRKIWVEKWQEAIGSAMKPKAA